MTFLGRFAVLLAITGTPALAAAEAVKHTTEYSITLAGFTIAKASFVTALENRDYTVSGSFRSAGIAGLVANISGQTSAAGTFAKGRFEASRYTLVYRRDTRARVYEVRLKNGNVTSTTIEPPPRRDPEGWVPVRDADLRRVLDPLSGLIIPSGKTACPATLPIYDGETRMDIVLTPKGRRPYKANGEMTEAIVCAARFVPKAGYRQGRKDIEFLKQAPMEIWFAKSDALNVYAPVYARIPTKVGNLLIAATRFGK